MQVVVRVPVGVIDDHRVRRGKVDPLNTQTTETALETVESQQQEHVTIG